MAKPILLTAAVLGLCWLTSGCSGDKSAGDETPATQPAASGNVEPQNAKPTNTESAFAKSTKAQPDAAQTAPARSELIPAGEMAPDFTAVDHRGETVRLSKLLQDHNVVLVFYPADFTPGCTKQLCNVRDDWSEFQKRDTIVLGVNPADADKHAEFAAKYEFPFPIIVDEGSRIAAAYGCKGMAFTMRTVYVIGRDGRVLLAESGMVPHETIFAALDAG